MTFCKRLSKNKASHAFFASVHCHPQTLDVLRTRAEPLGIEVVVGDERELGDVSAFFGACCNTPPATVKCSTTVKWFSASTPPTRWSPSRPTCWP